MAPLVNVTHTRRDDGRSLGKNTKNVIMPSNIFSSLTTDENKLERLATIPLPVVYYMVLHLGSILPDENVRLGWIYFVIQTL